MSFRRASGLDPGSSGVEAEDRESICKDVKIAKLQEPQELQDAQEALQIGNIYLDEHRKKRPTNKVNNRFRPPETNVVSGRIS